MKTTICLGALFVLLPILVGAYPSSADCPSGDYIVVMPNVSMEHNVSTVAPNFTCINFTLPGGGGIRKSKANYSSVLMQYHVWDSNVTASLEKFMQKSWVAQGDHVGVVRLLSSTDKNFMGYVGLSPLENKTEAPTDALIMYTPLNYTVPVPGACNQEFQPETDPNLHVVYQPDSVLFNVTFSEANVGFRPGDQPACEGNAPKHDQLRYDFYIRYLPWGRYSRDSLFSELQKMMTPRSIREHGRKIHTFGKHDKPELWLSTFNGRGVILNIVVWDSISMAESAYVPTVTYACRDKMGSLCEGRIDPLQAVLFALGVIAGAAVCFVGHRYFLAEVFFFGFLPFTLFSFMILAANTSLSQPVMLVLALVFGVPGGCIWMAIWWRFGYVLPVMMWISFTLGFLFSAIIFFTPFGNLSVWYNSLAYGMAYMCGVMIIPVIFIVFTKFLSMLACAVWGGYLIVAALSYYSGGVLQYILLNIIHRSFIPHYSEAYIVVPVNPLDIALIVVWFILIVAGVAVQHRITRGRRNFPICPYKERKYLRNHRHTLRDQIRYESSTPQPSRHQMADPTETTMSHAGTSADADDTSPLVVND